MNAAGAGIGGRRFGADFHPCQEAECIGYSVEQGFPATGERVMVRNGDGSQLKAQGKGDDVCG
jgi:hypothetical protein